MACQELKLLEDDLWEAADQLRANSKLTAREGARIRSGRPVKGQVSHFPAVQKIRLLFPRSIIA